MKRYFLIALIIPLFIACSKDEETLNDSIVKIATVENPSQLTNYYLNLDDSTRLLAIDSELKYYRPKDEQRVIVDYTILSHKPNGSSYDHDVRVNDIYEILTKGIFSITPTTQDSIGNDPITIQDMWIAGDFMNFEFIYPGYSKTHFVNLVKDDLKTYTDGKMHLEFRHNANDDYPSLNISGIVCFNLKSIRKAGATSVDLVIHTKEFGSSDERTYNYTYKYGAAASSAPEKRILIPAKRAKVK